MKPLITWFKNLLYIVKNYDKTVSDLYKRIGKSEEIIRERTLTGVSIDRHDSFVVTIGRYRGKEFVNCYQIPDHDFPEIVEHLKSISRYSQIGPVDASPHCKAVFDKELQDARFKGDNN